VRAARGVPGALVVLAAGTLAATSCAYFNGMYYANRYARQAQGSERAGRTAEARDRWAQAEMHAESLIARHAGSRWVGEAQLVRGRALVHLELYSDAVLALLEATRRGRPSTPRWSRPRRTCAPRRCSTGVGC
jgi:hypothetical protein